LGVAAVPGGKLSGPGHTYQLVTGCLETGKGSGVVQLGDRHDYAVGQVGQACLHDLAGLHPRDGAHVHALARVELRTRHPGADNQDSDPRSATSAASNWLKVTRNDLVLAYTARLGKNAVCTAPLKASREATLMTVPRDRASMPVSAARVNRTGARTLSSTSSAAYAGGRSANGM